MTVDPYNRWKHHTAVVGASVALAVLLWIAGYSISRIVAAIPWFLLFLVLLIGPATKLWPSIRSLYGGNFPLNWRSELGVWFVIWSAVHVLVVIRDFGWGEFEILIRTSPAAFAALVALIIAVILAITSNIYAFQFLGTKSWKWHQSHGTYVLFWLLVVHLYQQTIIRGGLPPHDPLHILYVISIGIVIVMHVTAFIVVVAHYREHDEYPSEIT